MSPEIEIPFAAITAASDVLKDDPDDVEYALLSAVPPIMAAELRRLADELDKRREEMREEDNRTVRSSGLGEGIRRLRERADELDPQGGAR